jgi:hypothetical protein
VPAFTFNYALREPYSEGGTNRPIKTRFYDLLGYRENWIDVAGAMHYLEQVDPWPVPNGHAKFMLWIEGTCINPRSSILPTRTFAVIAKLSETLPIAARVANPML